ncbi:malonate decarboxylase holo-ACP synthase [Gallaecimonas xiamenensis]|uniref:Phosphoribosyl-dephospho-CoA transferase n=1 Tax=Gallaecimonas xiamenensis 3-C-1 TaxID=745411 RepID=K2J8T8_9GAMM|nr:malonate decarboxylase holo-ACP synthase [Gallaecimonas xiamenensis]EKE71638.1 phosphoribosyl-dephospho-CoA transferase [Gallaecimonas xiamenensis 3-C-1]
MNWQPHDLLWVKAGSLLAPAGEQLAPWAAALTGPVVVRRAPSSATLVPVGLRGSNKAERQGAFVPKAAVEKALTPFDLVRHKSWFGHRLRGQHPVLVTLDRIAGLLGDYQWGITGSLGYELASGIRQLTGSSDLDLLLRCQGPLARSEAKALWQALNLGPCQLDVQLALPGGAVALAEWAGPSTKVLLKTDQGPLLTGQPWQEQVA